MELSVWLRLHCILSNAFVSFFIHVQAALEIVQYLSSTPTCDDTLEFWPQNAAMGMFPTLTQLAQLHLSSRAASVPVECMFSTAGLVANGKWSNLSTEKLHRICFVHDNYKLVCWNQIVIVILSPLKTVGSSLFHWLLFKFLLHFCLISFIKFKLCGNVWSKVQLNFSRNLWK